MLLMMDFGERPPLNGGPKVKKDAAIIDVQRSICDQMIRSGEQAVR